MTRPARAMSAPVFVGRPGGPPRAFTLVELLVVIVIVMILSGLALAGMATARRGANVDRTRNTIRKIHEIVMPQYESYLRRRVPIVTPSQDARANALARLVTIRQAMVYEMPDSWSDVGAAPPAAATGPVLAYAAMKAALGASVAAANGGAECLYMIASRGPGDPDVMERFRTEEVGDTDKDGAPEFLDAWGRPIDFMRWAPGVAASPAQPADETNFHDPLDPMRVDPAGFALVPLIVSQGPDGGLGLAGPPSAGWSALIASPGLSSIVNAAVPKPGTTTGGEAADNISNHDLSKK